MANKSDYRVRKCTDGQFRVFTSSEAEIWSRKPIEEKYWKGETGYPSRDKAWESLNGCTYSSIRQRM